MNINTTNRQLLGPQARSFMGSVEEPAVVEKDELSLLRNLIWLYLILWLTEGGLRRWFLPGLSTPLLLIRDPLVIIIYAVAILKKVFPLNGFILFGAVLGYLTFANALILGHGNVMVALYGVRCDFLHVPLIFIMGAVLKRRHLIAVSKVAVWLLIPYTALLVTQFYSPQDAWINKGVGDSTEGAGFVGALGRYRPPGTFSFISGPVVLYPMFAACLFALIITRNISTPLLMTGGAALVVALPVSVSRALFVCVGVVIATGAVAIFTGGRFSARLFLQLAIVAVILPLIVTNIAPFKDGVATFRSRWDASTTDGGGVKTAIVDRMAGDLFGSFGQVGNTQLGTGYSTNVGQKLLTQDVGFGASESEWGRLVYDNGFTLGIMLVGYRIALTLYILALSLRAWRHRSTLGIVFMSAACLELLSGEWGQASTLGGSVIAAGLALAAASEPDVPDVAPDQIDS